MTERGQDDAGAESGQEYKVLTGREQAMGSENGRLRAENERLRRELVRENDKLDTMGAQNARLRQERDAFCEEAANNAWDAEQGHRRIAELEEVLRELIKPAPRHFDSYCCRYCGNPGVHSAACPWERARRVLAEGEGDT